MLGIIKAIAEAVRAVAAALAKAAKGMARGALKGGLKIVKFGARSAGKILRLPGDVLRTMLYGSPEAPKGGGAPEQPSEEAPAPAEAEGPDAPEEPEAAEPDVAITPAAEAEEDLLPVSRFQKLKDEAMDFAGVPEHIARAQNLKNKVKDFAGIPHDDLAARAELTKMSMKDTPAGMTIKPATVENLKKATYPVQLTLDSIAPRNVSQQPSAQQSVKRPNAKL